MDRTREEEVFWGIDFSKAKFGDEFMNRMRTLMTDFGEPVPKTGRQGLDTTKSDINTSLNNIEQIIRFGAAITHLVGNFEGRIRRNKQVDDYDKKKVDELTARYMLAVCRAGLSTEGIVKAAANFFTSLANHFNEKIAKMSETSIFKQIKKLLTPLAEEASMLAVGLNKTVAVMDKALKEKIEAAEKVIHPGEGEVLRAGFNRSLTS